MLAFPMLKLLQEDEFALSGKIESVVSSRLLMHLKTYELWSSGPLRPAVDGTCVLALMPNCIAIHDMD